MELQQDEKEEVNNESHKGKILRMNKSQTNGVNPGGRASVGNVMNQTGNGVEVHPHVHVTVTFVFVGNDSVHPPQADQDRILSVIFRPGIVVLHLPLRAN